MRTNAEDVTVAAVVANPLPLADSAPVCLTAAIDGDETVPLKRMEDGDARQIDHVEFTSPYQRCMITRLTPEHFSLF